MVVADANHRDLELRAVLDELGWQHEVGGPDA